VDNYLRCQAENWEHWHERGAALRRKSRGAPGHAHPSGGGRRHCGGR
jgi:hypothetical protein